MDKRRCVMLNGWVIAATYFELTAAAAFIPPPRYQEGSISALR
jgi:hypothetical protein